MWLIDAKEAEKMADKIFGKDTVSQIIAKKLIRATPTIDAVPVVRCKDCKHYQNGRVFTDIKFCFRLKDSKGKAIGHTRSNNDFCGYGERKE